MTKLLITCQDRLDSLKHEVIFIPVGLEIDHNSTGMCDYDQSETEDDELSVLTEFGQLFDENFQTLDRAI